MIIQENSTSIEDREVYTMDILTAVLNQGKEGELEDSI